MNEENKFVQSFQGKNMRIQWNLLIKCLVDPCERLSEPEQLHVLTPMWLDATDISAYLKRGRKIRLIADRKSVSFPSIRPFSLPSLSFNTK